MWLPSAATAAASISDIRAWETLDDTGLTRSSDMVRRLRSSADDAAFTKEGTAYLVLLMIGTLRPLPRSSEELDLPAP